MVQRVPVGAGNKKLLGVAVVGGIVTFAGPQTLAQTTPVADPAVGGESIEEVVVKARFIASDASSAMKVDVPVRDIPFTTAAYTESFIKAVQAVSVADLYPYMTGIQRAGTTGYDLSIRGFTTKFTDRNAIMVDGLPGLSARFGSPPTIGTDHIEVVKGPASVLYGAAQPGGFVNIVAKKPQADADTAFEIRDSGYVATGLPIGDKTNYNVSLDKTGPVDAGGALLYRLVAQGGRGELFRDTTKSFFVSPSLTWNVSPVTSVRLQYEYNYERNAYDQGMVAPNRDVSLAAPINTRYETPSDFQWEQGQAEVLSLAHTFDNEVKWNLGWRNVAQEDKSAGYDIVAILPDNKNLQMRARGQYNQRTYDFADTSFNIPFQTGPVAHKLLVGLNGGKETSDFNRLQFYNIPTSGPGAAVLSIYNPDYSVLPALSSLGPYLATGMAAQIATAQAGQNWQVTSSLSTGAYLSDFVTFSDNWKGTVAVRYARERQFEHDLRLALPSFHADISKVTPLVGLLYQPDKSWTVYSSYNTGFVPAPATSIDINGVNNFKPETSKQVEVGAKADLLDGNLNSTLSFFNIDKKDVLSTFTCPLGTCTQQIGGQNSKGMEFEVNAKILENWQVAFGWAHTDSTITQSSDPIQVGTRQTNAPLDSAHVWSRYDIKTGTFRGLGVGVGVSYNSQRQGVLITTAKPLQLILPAYTMADLGLYYNWAQSDVTFKVSNVFDKRYFASAGAGGELALTPGTPRTLTLSFRTHF